MHLKKSYNILLYFVQLLSDLSWNRLLYRCTKSCCYICRIGLILIVQWVKGHIMVWWMYKTSLSKFTQLCNVWDILPDISSPYFIFICVIRSMTYTCSIHNLKTEKLESKMLKIITKMWNSISVINVAYNTNCVCQHQRYKLQHFQYYPVFKFINKKLNYNLSGFHQWYLLYKNIIT